MRYPVGKSGILHGMQVIFNDIDKTRKSYNNQLSNFGLIKEMISQSHKKLPYKFQKRKNNC